MPGMRRHDHGRDRQLLRQRRAVQRAGAAERHQREVARVVAAAGSRSAARRRPCWRWRPAMIASAASCGVDAAAARRRPRVIARRRPARDRAACSPPTSSGAEPAEHDVGVGVRRLRAAACRSRPGRARRPPTAGRCAASRPRRSRPASRRRRRSSAPRSRGSRSGGRTRRTTRWWCAARRRRRARCRCGAAHVEADRVRIARTAPPVWRLGDRRPRRCRTRRGARRTPRPPRASSRRRRSAGAAGRRRSRRP